MKTRQRQLLIWGWLPLVLLSAGSLAAEDVRSDSEPVASVTWGRESIEFTFKVGDELTLTIIGPDFVYRARGRQSLSFDASEDDGTPLIDGTYHYELRQVTELSRDVLMALQGLQGQDQLRVKRQLRREGRWPPPRPLTQDSAFHIHDGIIKAPAAQKEDTGE